MQLLGWFEDPAGDHLYIAMEYLRGGDLERWSNRNSTFVKERAEAITMQLLKGLVALHGMCICHRDLKPQVCFHFASQ